jgi:hypothetical protein
MCRVGITRWWEPGWDLLAAGRLPKQPQLPGAADGLGAVGHHRRPGFAFDGALGDIARTWDVATAGWVAKTLQSPIRPQLAGPAWPWTLTLRPVLVFAAGVAAVLGVRLLGRRRRGGSAEATGPPHRPHQQLPHPASTRHSR